MGNIVEKTRELFGRDRETILWIPTSKKVYYANKIFINVYKDEYKDKHKCSDCGNKLVISGFVHDVNPTYSSHDRVVGYYSGPGYANAVPKYEVVVSTLYNEVSVPNGNIWDHCCECNMNWPHGEGKFPGHGNKDFDFYDNDERDISYNFIHCCKCKVVYDSCHEKHCHACGKVFSASSCHKCDKTK
jgi:hypothetical protein